MRDLREGDHLDQYLLTDALARTADHPKPRPWIARLAVRFALAGLASLIWLSRPVLAPPAVDQSSEQSR